MRSQPAGFLGHHVQQAAQFPSTHPLAAQDQRPRRRGVTQQHVSAERESVYFWRLGMHFFFGGSSSP
jgi:hypothetical protein